MMCLSSLGYRFLFCDSRGLRFLGVAASVVAPFLDWRSVMNCENYFCLYQNDGQCTLDSIEIDINGSCATCIYVDIQEDELRSLKQKQLDSLEE